MQRNFRVFGDRIFFNLWIPHSGIPVTSKNSLHANITLFYVNALPFGSGLSFLDSAYHLHRKHGNSGWKMKCYIPFPLERFRNYKLSLINALFRLNFFMSFPTDTSTFFDFSHFAFGQAAALNIYTLYFHPDGSCKW